MLRSDPAVDAATPGEPVRPAPLAWLGLGALIGILSAGLAVGVGEAAAVFVRPAAAPIIVVGNRVILLTPESIRRWAIREFGTNDKPTLLLGIYTAIAIFAVGVGVLALYRGWLGQLGLMLFGVIGVYCALTTHAHQATDVIPTLFATVAGVIAIGALTRAAVGDDQARLLWPARGRPGGSPGPIAKRQLASPRLLANRRQFLQGSAATAAIAALTGLGGRAGLHKRYDVSQARSAVSLPRPASPAPALANGTDLGKSGVPWLTPVGGFYRIDTALVVPQLNPDAWQLNIHGMVDKPIQLSYADLLARPLIERWITLTCVSNEVGGNLIGNARFLGAPLADILREAGVHAGADQLVCRSSDGMTIGTPTAVVMDGRDAMLAVGMDGAPLPVEHGFPVRMVVPGLYGYVSACKWIVDIEATTFSAYSAYWVAQGWIAQAPIMTESRIDAPRSGGSVQVGQPTAIAGVAWQQHVGISKVEVQVDIGPWEPARLAAVPSIDTWRQWVLPWTPSSPGSHTIRVRATDNEGKVQTSANAEPYPGAATGWHSISVTARS